MTQLRETHICVTQNWQGLICNRPSQLHPNNAMTFGFTKAWADTDLSISPLLYIIMRDTGIQIKHNGAPTKWLPFRRHYKRQFWDLKPVLKFQFRWSAGVSRDSKSILVQVIAWHQSGNKPLSRPFMMTSSNGNIFRATGHLCREFTVHRWIPRTKASDAELWCFPWSASE